MLAPTHPADEPQRQQALDQMELLDTPAEQYLDTLVQLTRDLFGVQSVLISLVDHDRQWFKARTGLLTSETERDLSFCAHALLGTSQLLVEDARLDRRFADNPLVTGPPFIRMYAGQPLHAGDGQPIGTLCLLHPQPRRLKAEEQRRLRDLATLAEGYLQMRSLSARTRSLRQAVDREQRRALLDPLTQLWNRAGLQHFQGIQQATANQAGRLLGALYADLDHFKQVNDCYGHAGGDQVLWESARRLTAALRPDDLLARVGGEEFVALVAVQSEQELAAIGERVRKTLADTPIPLGEHLHAQTISIGIALAQPGEAVSSTLERADAALYRAKREGRNRVARADHKE